MVASAKKREPLKSNGSLDKYDYFEVTPIIGRQYTDLQISDLVESDEMIQEFAYVVSNRGVVFLRDQELSLKDQKYIVQRMGELSGKPAESHLQIHPAVNAKSNIIVDEEAQNDPNAHLISNRLWDLYFGRTVTTDPKQKIMEKKNSDMALQWHSDLMSEIVPADYSFLRMVKHPKSGSDTLWASSVELYNRLSEPMQEYLKTLTATATSGDKFLKAEAMGNYKLYTDPRGHPLNSGKVYTAKQPMIRTNPVTGKNSVYAVGLHSRYVNDVTKEESDYIMNMLLNKICRNHDLQVRFRWLPKSIAVWDNRSVHHAATLDGDDVEERLGIRVSGIGEIPYLDPTAG